MYISRRYFAAGALAGLAGLQLDRGQVLAPRPKLFIFLIAEQFREIYLERIAAGLTQGGFNQLITKGIFYPNCHLASSGFTASGLATLVAGAYPQLHGIIADQWYDRATHAPVKPRTDMLEATTLADQAAEAGNSRVFCLGLRERQTSLLAGQSGAQTFWMDEKGRFDTRGDVPDWLTAFNASESLDSLHDKNWNAVGATSGTPPLRTLTYDAKHPEEFFALYQSSPFAQDAQFRLLHMLADGEKLGQGKTLDFVFVALGSMALLGYETGSDSPLMDQMTLRLDLRIQGMLEMLNKAPGKGNYNLIFAAAHGAPPEPDPSARPQKAIFGETVARAINKALGESIDKYPPFNTYVEKYVYPFLYLKLDALREKSVALPGARRLAGEAALRVPGVAGYYTKNGDCSHTGEWRRRFENSFHDPRSGDVMLSYEVGAVEDFGGGRGVSYGSLYNYDTQVPLFLYGAQFGSRRIERAIELVDLAPTMARAAGLSPPSSTTGAVLAEAFAESNER